MGYLKNVGILGGSFDPVHFGHLKCAESLLEQGKVEKILFMPTGQSPHKDSKKLTPAVHRLNMLKLATQEDPRFEVSSYEMNRKGISYTVDTLQYLKKENPEVHYFFILGADNLKTIHTWKNYSELIERNDFLLLQRPGFSLDWNGALKLTKNEFNKITGSLISVPMIKTSATLIRALLKHSSKSTQAHTTKNVWTYILNNSLYS